MSERTWPERSGADRLAPFKLHARAWGVLEQQRPAPEEGDDFKADLLRTVERIPGKRAALPALPARRLT